MSTPFSFGESNISSSSVLDILKPSPTTEMNISLQHYLQYSNGKDVSPPTIDDTKTYFNYKSGDSVIKAVCMPTGCQSLGAISCEGNQVGKLDGGCECAEGFELDMGRSGSICSEKKTCPEGTFMTGHMASDSSCQCENNIAQTIELGAPNTCLAADEIGGNCGADPRGDDFAGEIEIAEWDECISSQNKAAMEAQRLENQSVAANNAQVAAADNLQKAIDAEAKSLAQNCRQAVNSFKQNCSSIRQIPQATNTSSASSKERCESLYDVARSGVESVQSDISRCVSEFNSLSAQCPSSTSSLTGSGEKTVRNGEGTYGAAVVVTESSSKSGSGPVPGVSSMLSEASTINSTIVSQGAQVETEMNNLRGSSEKCIAAFTEDPEDPSGNQFLNQASQFAAAGANIASNGGYDGELSGGSYKGGGASSSTSSTNPYGRGSSSSSSRNNDSSYDHVSSANTDGVPDEGVYSNGQSISNNGAPNQTNVGSGSRNKISNAGGFNVANGSARVGANAKNKKSKYKSAEARNLIFGHKNVKASDGGGSLSIRPSDFKKFGRAAMKKKLAAARGLYGKKIPLIFRNGKFVRDFLAMKETAAFKKKNAAMANRLKGGSSRDLASNKILHVHKNRKLNIFKIMNFRYYRQRLRSD